MLTRAQGLIDRQVHALATDRAGNMWAATEAAGVMKIQAAGFTTFREQDGLATDRVWSVLASRPRRDGPGGDGFGTPARCGEYIRWNQVPCDVSRGF